jgi:GTP-binding protein
MEAFDPKTMAKGVKFLGSFDASPPSTKLPEVAFVGRSNVGKSSLLNSLTAQKIAVTSKTPGRTQRINIFAVKDDTNSKVAPAPRPPVIGIPRGWS